MKVGFIGLGTMGLPMAQNLVRSQLQVTGYDLSASARAALAETGGSVAKNAAQAATGARFIVTMLPTAAHVEAALLGDGGAISGAEPEAVVINMSTILPEETEALSKKLEAKGHRLIDAPVGRSALEAARGALLILASGTPEDIEAAKPLFESMGNQTINCGSVGNGSRVKVINNFMGISLNALTAEVLTLAEASGLDIRLALDVMRGTIAGMGHMKITYPNKVLKGDLEAGFPVDLAHKDLVLALNLAARVNAPVFMGSAALQSYSVTRADGRGRQDYTAVYPVLRDLADLPKAIPYDASKDEEFNPFA